MKQSTPRRVNCERVGFSRIFNMIFGLVFFLGWGIFMLVNDPTVWDHVMLNHRGIRAEARLLGTLHTPVMVNRKPVYSIDLGFNDRHGRPVRARLWSNDDLFIGQLSPDRPVAIEYDPEKPSRCRFAGNGIGLMDIATVLCCVMGLSLFLAGFFSTCSLVRLLRSGTRATARVTRTIATSQTTKSGTIMNIRYEFTTGTGKPAGGFYKTTKPLEVGAEIMIVYNPRRPWKNMPG